MLARTADTSPVTLVSLSREIIIEQSRASGEPAWLTDQRADAWDKALEMPPPEWRRTDLSRLKTDQLTFSWATPGTTFVSSDEAHQKGVIFLPLREALAAYGDLIRNHLGSVIDPYAHKHNALRAALWQDGALLYVPRKVQLEQPLTLRYTLPENGTALFARTLVILEEQASLTLIEEAVSPDTTEMVFVSPATELILGAGSNLRYISAQHWGENVTQIGSQTVATGQDSQVEWVSLSLGGAVQHQETEARLQGNGSRVTWYGATFGNHKQRLVNTPVLRHIGASCESHMDFKTVVTDEAYSVFDGLIKIEAESRATSTRLEEHAIHLSDTARSDSIPALKIDTNDVSKAGHASTSGEVDAEQLFYMRARGITLSDAIRMIIMGFFDPALARLPEGDLRETLAQIIESKIA